MATRLCECGKVIAGNTDRCPYCGKRYTLASTWLALVFVVVTMLVVGIMLSLRG